MAATFMAPTACLLHTSPQPLQSNVAQVRVSEDDRLIAVEGGGPYTGTLVARGAEITPLARLVFRGTPAEDAITELDTSGLILVLPIQGGLPSGRAVLHADLQAPKLSDALERIDAIGLARVVTSTIEVGEATFANGRLEGTAILRGPGADAPLPLATLAEASFHRSVLSGSVREFFPGGGQLKRELGFEGGVRSGEQREFYASGSLERESTFVDGVLHGNLTEYYADGSKRAESSFERGTAVGQARAWFPTGQLQREVSFEANGGPIVKTWFSNGAPESSVDGQGAKVLYPADGTVVTFYRSGAVRTKAQYAAGVQHGPFEVLYSSGKRWESGRFENGHRAGVHKKWWKNGRLALESSYSEGELEGMYKRWYASGTLWEQATYEAGKREGRYQKWWKNGAVAHDYRYVAGKLEGDVLTYYDTGAQWAVGRYAAGKPQGTLKRWFPDGRLGYIKHHRQGRAVGAHKRWYADGKLRLDATYVNGKLDGEFKNWREDGSVYEFATYQLGKKIETTLVESTPF